MSETWDQEASSNSNWFVLIVIKIVSDNNIVIGRLTAFDHCSHILKLVPLDLDLLSEVFELLLIHDLLFLHFRFHLSNSLSETHYQILLHLFLASKILRALFLLHQKVLQFSSIHGPSGRILPLGLNICQEPLIIVSESHLGSVCLQISKLDSEGIYIL